MGKIEKIRLELTIAGLAVGLLSLGLTIYNRFVLTARLEGLQRTALVGLFSLSEPSMAEPLLAKQETTLHGTYVAAIPDGYKVRAVLYSRNEYYVSRPIPHLDVDHTWDLLIRPWPGQWRLYLCLSDPKGTRALDEWSAERTPDGMIDWNNPRLQLPQGVHPNSVFPFEAR